MSAFEDVLNRTFRYRFGWKFLPGTHVVLIIKMLLGAYKVTFSSTQLPIYSGRPRSHALAYFQET